MFYNCGLYSMRGARIINVAPLSGFPREIEGGALWGGLGGLGSSFLVAGQAKGCLRDHLVACGEDG